MSEILRNLIIILVQTRFPENIGMTARACANMGCSQIRLVNPEFWDIARAMPLATPKGLPVLENISQYAALEDAIADVNLVFAATARLGGWRRQTHTPRQTAEKIRLSLLNDEMAAIVFGPEDRGLDNAQISLCPNIAHIPTYGGASSLNLAQSALIFLYECASRMAGAQIMPQGNGPKKITMEEQARLENELKEILLRLDCLHGDNPGYFFIQWQNIIEKAGLRRNEYDALMGFCRQLRNRVLSEPHKY